LRVCEFFSYGGLPCKLHVAFPEYITVMNFHAKGAKAENITAVEGINSDEHASAEVIQSHGSGSKGIDQIILIKVTKPCVCFRIETSWFGTKLV
jgi:hypothetical protein